MNKKVVWLPYDFDTALGINNEGALVFSYNLEDIDHLEGGADVFNGQESVVWVNMRDAFGDDIKAMYQQLRSDGEFSYDVVEQMFETHQDKWSEAIFNEDSYFKYLAPLVAPDTGKDPTASYLNMLQGSKKEQRKWWMYNRFRYMDSKYNAGDALTDVIQLRGYAKADISVTPYADVYASVKYGSYLVQSRAQRNVPVTLVCPLDKVNDTEIYIYSASQLAAIGDLSGLQVGFADFSMGTKLQALKVGDSTSGFSNANLKELHLGNNALLQTLDVRNCVALGTDTQKTVDISGCTNIENVYFDGTAIQGLALPNGGVLKVLHLPSTITNLTIMNQQAITDLTVAGYSNISTLRIENSSVDSKTILNSIPANARVRLIGFTWEAEDATEIEALLDTLDTMRGLDEAGNNVDTAQVSGTIHTDSLTGAQIASYNARYPYLNVVADHTSCQLKYYNFDGSSLLNEETVLDGGNGTWTSQPARASTAQYTFTFVGWSRSTDASTAQSDALNNVTADRNVYAAYSRTVRTYTATFVRASEDGGGTLYTQQNIPYGTVPTYGGETPTTTRGTAEELQFNGWSPALAEITGNTTYTAVFKDLRSITRQLIQRTIRDASNENITAIGNYAFYACYNLTTASFPAVTSISNYAFANCASLTSVSFPAVTHIGNYAFRNCSSLTSVSFPAVTYIGTYAFAYCSSLTSVSFPAVTYISAYAFRACSSLTTVSFPALTSIGNYAFQSCRTLMSLYLTNSSVATLDSSSTFVGTPMSSSIYTGTFGSIYVPASLIADYKVASNWSYYSDRITAYVE